MNSKVDRVMHKIIHKCQTKAAQEVRRELSNAKRKLVDSKRRVSSLRRKQTLMKAKIKQLKDVEALARSTECKISSIRRKIVKITTLSLGNSNAFSPVNVRKIRSYKTELDKLKKFNINVRSTN
ncbi:MAG: hypothetical protein SVK08_00995 [Halobacteriota archaeon]|nr:hypothetical protein [Halobacteriota archaeon]